MNKQRILAIVLVVSLALNCTFLVTSFLWRGKKQPTRRSFSSREIAMSFAANEEQRAKIDTVYRNFRLEVLELKQDIFAHRVDILEELGNPEYNMEDIQNWLNELNSLEARLNSAFIDSLIAITNILDSRQRLQFIYQLSRSWYYMNHSNTQGGRNE